MKKQKKLSKVPYVIFWKKLALRNNKLVTPHMLKEVKLNSCLKANNPLIKTEIENIQNYNSGAEVHGGGIHVYRTRSKARNRWNGAKLFKVKCMSKDFIACNENEACFTKVFILADKVH